MKILFLISIIIQFERLKGDFRVDKSYEVKKSSVSNDKLDELLSKFADFQISSKANHLGVRIKKTKNQQYDVSVLVKRQENVNVEAVLESGVKVDEMTTPVFINLDKPIDKIGIAPELLIRYFKIGEECGVSYNTLSKSYYYEENSKPFFSEQTITFKEVDIESTFKLFFGYLKMIPEFDILKITPLK